METRTLTLDGYMVGRIWWPVGAPASLPVRDRLDRSRFLERPSIVDMLDSYLAEHGGDFQGALFHPETTLEIRSVAYLDSPSGVRHQRRWEHVHTLRLADLPSCAHLVSTDTDEIEPIYGGDWDD